MKKQSLSTVINEKKRLLAAAEYVLSKGHKLVDSVEVAIQKRASLDVTVRLSDIESIESSYDGALFITFYKNSAKGSLFTADLTRAGLDRAISAALSIVQYTSADSFSGLANKEQLAFDAPDLNLYDAQEWPVSEMITHAKTMEKSAFTSDKRIVHSEGAKFSSHYAITFYGNSHGFLRHYCTSEHLLSCRVIAEHNGEMEKQHAYTVARKPAALACPESVGKEAAQRAIARLNPQKLRTMTLPVLFAAEAATTLFSHLAAAIKGDNIYRKASFLLNSIDRPIFPAWLNITEDPYAIGALASRPFDSEGVKPTLRPIIQAGKLQTYLLSSYSARKLNSTTTGHAGGIYNWYVTGPTKDFSEMLRILNKGLLVTQFIGSGINLMTGDYSRGVAGFWIEGGEIQYPVSEITIAGNLQNMFKQIIAIGDDTEKRSTIQSGAVLIESMRIAGV